MEGGSLLWLNFLEKIGYVFSQVETVPGVWENQEIEKNYRGDEVLNQQRWEKI